jgi:Cu+-exporting ATPase
MQEQSGNSGKAPSNGTKYTCPMHPEVLSDKPGNCSKCGMSLEPMMPKLSKTKTIYTCPMHPEIEQDHPGQCPKCGMTLEPKTVGDGDESEKRSFASLPFSCANLF